MYTCTRKQGHHLIDLANSWFPSPWWRHQMETFSALLALCEGKPPADSPHKGQWRRAWMFSFICAWTNAWANNWDAGDLRRHCAHCDVTVMNFLNRISIWTEWIPQPMLAYCYLDQLKFTWLKLDSFHNTNEYDGNSFKMSAKCWPLFFRLKWVNYRCIIGSEAFLPLVCPDLQMNRVYKKQHLFFIVQRYKMMCTHS